MGRSWQTQWARTADNLLSDMADSLSQHLPSIRSAVERLDLQKDEAAINLPDHWTSGYRIFQGRAHHTQAATHNLVPVSTVGRYLRRQLTPECGTTSHLIHRLLLRGFAVCGYRHGQKSHCQSLDRSQHYCCDDSWIYEQGACRKLYRATFQ